MPEDKGPSRGSILVCLEPRLPTPILTVPRGHDAGMASVGGAATSPSPAPQAYATVTVKPSGSPTRLLKVGALVLISGAVLLLFGAIGAFYFWKGNDNHVSSTSGSSWDARAAWCAGWPNP